MNDVPLHMSFKAKREREREREREMMMMKDTNQGISHSMLKWNWISLSETRRG